jgi:hypothetical protein
LRKRNPLRLAYKSYLNNRDSSRISFDDWKQKNEWEDTDKCGRCGAWKGESYICPGGKFYFKSGDPNGDESVMAVKNY